MIRTAFYSLLAGLGLMVLAPVASAQTVFQSVGPSYQPNFRYMYGYGVYPSYYYNPGVIVWPQAQIFTIQFRRFPGDYWLTFARTYNQREALYYANYLGNIGFQSRVFNSTY